MRTRRHKRFEITTPDGKKMTVKGDPNMAPETKEALGKLGDAVERAWFEKRKGERVIMTGRHPWRGEVGIFTGLEETFKGPRPVIELDNGTRCFAMGPGEFKFLDLD